MRIIIIIHLILGMFYTTFGQKNYAELTNPNPPVEKEWNNIKNISMGWGDSDLRYRKEVAVKSSMITNSVELNAWKGEKVSALFVISSKKKLEDVTYKIDEFKRSSWWGENISEDNINSGFVRYVMTDELNKGGKGGCGYRNKVDFDSSLVADPIDQYAKFIEIEAKSTRLIWVGVNVARNIKTGKYKSHIHIMAKGKIIGSFPIQINVNKRVLPIAKDWNFHLDLWQNPYAVARIHKVTPWSKSHFKAMENAMKLYADAGGKVITTSIIYKPWNGQTFDPFDSMIEWNKGKDGKWNFDYKVFDKWVEFMMQLGVDKQINCYSMIPWNLSFRYFDEGTSSYKFINAKPGEKEYSELWGVMLKDFAKHLKSKGWFEKTHISMDERPMKAMLETLKVIRNADKDFKVSLAGALHKELIDELDDYCVALRMKFKEKDLEKRRLQGKVTTFYTSCEEAYPNTFTFSPPSECEWFAWYAAKSGMNGYLRWALNSWGETPLQDSRFRTWAAGDTYMIYPDGRSSLRFEKLIAGIQAFEKIHILRNEFVTEKDYTSLGIIDRALAEIDERIMDKISAAQQIKNAKKILSELDLF